MSAPAAGFDGRWVGAAVPRKEDRQTPSRHSETGAKGMGEGGTIGAPAAVLNAINDALSDTDVRFDHIPVLPHELAAVL